MILDLKFNFMRKIIVFGLVLVSLVSCGPSTKVHIEGTRDAITVTTNQSVSDSTSLNININPNIQLK